MYENKFLTGLAMLGLIGLGWFAASLPSLKPPAKEQVLQMFAGPMRVPAHTKPVDATRGVATAIIATSTFEVPEDGWITSFAPTYAGVPDQSLRFSWLFDASSPDPYWPNLPRVVFVMSLEKTPNVSFPPGYGYFVKKGAKLMILGGFANFTDAEYPSAVLRANVTFVPVSSGNKLGDAYPLFLNAEPASVFTIPPHTQYFEKKLKKPFVMPFNGRIVMLASHGHKLLQQILLTLNGKELWKTSPVHLPDGTNLGNPFYHTPFNGVPVNAGDVLDLSEIYSNPTNAITDAMSSMYIQIIPGTSTSPVMQH